MTYPDPIWTIRLLGTLKLESRFSTISHFRTRKTASLLAYLALNPQNAHSRTKLIDLLWPDSHPSDGRNSLRVSLNALRSQLEPKADLKGKVLLALGDRLQLNSQFCTTDVDRFQQHLRDADRTAQQQKKIFHWQEALKQYGGDLLPSDTSIWVEQEAGRLRDLHLATLCRLGQALLGEGKNDLALSYAGQAVQLDPLCETCHLLLMQVYVKLNRPARAIQQYQQLKQIWALEFQCLPSSALRHWVTRVLNINPDV